MDWETFKFKNPVITDLKKNPHFLITGKSGSGKSQSFLWYAYHILQDKESRLYLADFKSGKEYGLLKGSRSYSYADNAVSMIYEYYEFYTQMRKNSLSHIPHTTLAIEEWFGLLGYLESKDKKQKADIMSKVGEILALGRGNRGLATRFTVNRRRCEA